MRRLRYFPGYSRPRLYFVVGIFGLSFLAILARLTIVQVGQYSYWHDSAEAQYGRRITVVPQRGRILDRRDNVLAASIPVPSVYVAPRQVEEPEFTAQMIAGIFPSLSESRLERQLTSRASFVWLARQVSPEKASALQALGLAGIHIKKETRRIYPRGVLAGSAIGYAGIDEQGLGGLEHQYDSALSAQPLSANGTRDARGRTVSADLDAHSAPPRGADLYLTLDMRLQHIAEKELEEQAKAIGARSGLVVIMDPYTGGILTLASYPFFNPNDYRNEKQRAWRRNRAVTDPIEPGSTFKVVAAAAALEEKTVALDEVFYCEKGWTRRNNRVLRDHKPFEFLTFPEVIENSSNICMVKINERITSEQFYDYIRRFGFGEKSLVDLPGEHPGGIRHPDDWSALSHDSLSIGQEIAVTPVQMVTAFSAIANGGWLLRPRLVDRLVKDDMAQAFKPERRRRVLSQDTANRLTSMLVGVVERGTGAQAALDGYLVAGKSGTAQKAENGGYSHSKVVVSFIGYAPAEAPRFVMLVMFDEPQRKRWGGSAAAPVFRSIAKQALHHLQVPPARARPVIENTQIANREEPNLSVER
ncbi:MAG: penicillin-binding protein 2 [Candidatus Tectomicrobia bacterium]|nr:penicillin-binding protein 2 [Candidatus Tectomicrobia bacterium]